MTTAALHPSLTYPKGFLDFLTLTPKRGHLVGDHELTQAGLDAFNTALAALSPESPTLTLDQMATAAQRALDRHKEGKPTSFVTSRMNVLARLESLAADRGWEPDPDLSRRLVVVHDYVAGSNRLVPDALPVVGRLDVAVLVDVLLQLEREDLAEYEDFCRFRQVAADYANLTVEETGLTRVQWIEALQQARDGSPRRYGRVRARFAPDPRASLFHVV